MHLPTNMADIFKPKLLDTIKGYGLRQFYKDLMAGVIVGIVALPLAVAFAIASGVSPEKGLYTAVIAGFTISLLGGSRVQIGGPTGAFIVVVYGIVRTYGIDGLIIATLMAGFMLIIMGVARMGLVIRVIPYPLIIGFTSGIALIIFSAQIKDFFGLPISNVPAGFVDKWQLYFQHFNAVNLHSLVIAAITVAILTTWPRISRTIPGSLIAIVLTTVVTTAFHLPVETVGSRFGIITTNFPQPHVPAITWDTVRQLIQPAFTIALLGGIESLLSAVVADGMTGGRHRSNTELIAQGFANIFSSLFGGIPATGAIARTATNIKNGGRTPVAGIVHALTLLIIVLFAGKATALIPMATLAGILVVVAYNMCEWQHFVSLLKSPRGDVAVLLTTFFLTVFADLTVAIEIGMVLATFLFIRNLIRLSGVTALTKVLEDEAEQNAQIIDNYPVPPAVDVFEITGPLFFGAAYKFTNAMRFIEKTPKVLIVRMRHVPVIDATGIKTLKELHNESKRRGIKLILSEVPEESLVQMQHARLLFAIGKANVTQSFDKALRRSSEILQDKVTHG